MTEARQQTVCRVPLLSYIIRVAINIVQINTIPIVPINNVSLVRAVVRPVVNLVFVLVVPSIHICIM